jgi:WD40 repeat protein
VRQRRRQRRRQQLHTQHRSQACIAAVMHAAAVSHVAARLAVPASRFSLARTRAQRLFASGDWQDASAAPSKACGGHSCSLCLKLPAPAAANCSTLHMRPIVLRGHTRPVTSLVFSKEGDLLFSGSTDKSISAWYADNGERLGTYAGHNGMVTSVDVSHNTAILASGAADGEARLWDVQSGACTRILKHSSKVTSVAFSLGSQYLLTANDPWKGACRRAIVYKKM